MPDWTIDPDEIESLLASGETIEDYDDGSRRISGHSGVRPLHLVIAQPQEDTTVVITVYEPSPDPLGCDVPV